MADRIAQVQVPFVDADTIAGASFVLEQSSREADPGRAYVRVHPGRTGITFNCTSGSFTCSQTGLTKRVETYESFNNSNTVTLRYPQPRNVVAELIGRFINEDGVPVNPTLSFDAARRTITSSIKGYGTLKVRYDAPYDLFLARFNQAGGGPRLINPYRSLIMIRDGVGFFGGVGTPDDDDDPTITGYFPMTVIGTKESGETHTMSPSATPDTDGNAIAGMAATDSKIPRLRIEIDPDYPPRLDGRDGGAGVVSASCYLRVYPNRGGARVVATAGSVASPGDPRSVYVRDAVSFSGSASASLQYQPAGGIDVEILSDDFFDIWGQRFTPRLKLPGDTFRAVTWVSPTTFGSPITRTVGPDEVIACDASGNSRPCYGVAELRYSATFRQHRYTFEYNADSKRFRTAYVAAIDGEQVAATQVNPPAMRGVY